MADEKDLNKIPPHNLEAEQATLGSILMDKDAIIKVADALLPEDFYSDKHRIIYEAMVDLFSKRDAIDVLSVTSRLEEKNQLEIVGGRGYLAELVGSVPTTSNVFQYATIVQRKGTLRRLIKCGQDIIKLGFTEADDTESVLDDAEHTLFSVSQKHLQQNFVPIQDILTETFERIDEIHKEGGKIRGVRTGFTDLDNVLGGLQKSDLLIMAARPAMGKSALVLNIARNVAVVEKIPVGVISLEMSKDQIIERLISMESGINLWRMRTGKLSSAPDSEDFPRIGQAMGILAEAPIFIDDAPLLNIMAIRARARRLQMEHGLGLLIVDYLQLLEGQRRVDNRVQEISEISRGLKAIARELNIPVIAVSQLSRAVEASHPPIPRLAHLRESGSIEQDADIVMFIYREDYYNKNSAKKNIADIMIAKHRNGPVGEIQLYFEIDNTLFKNLDAQRHDNFQQA